MQLRYNRERLNFINKRIDLSLFIINQYPFKLYKLASRIKLDNSNNNGIKFMLNGWYLLVVAFEENGDFCKDSDIRILVTDIS